MEAIATALDQALELKSLREATPRARLLEAVRECAREGEPLTAERLAALVRLEEHFQTVLLYDQIEFLRQPASLPEADRDFALNVHRICLEAANGFQRFLRDRQAWQGAEPGETAAHVTGLALNAIHGLIKWGYFLNDPTRVPPWRQVHALFALAEAENYAQAPFVLHASRPSYKTSVQSLYLRTLLLDLLNAGNLSRLQIEIADGWLASWCGDYSLDTAYSPRHHLFCVDLASESGLHLMRQEVQGGSMRYVRAEALKAQIDEVQAGLRRGQLFAGHGAGAVFPVEAHVALLATIEKLHRSIQAGSANRIEERTQFEDREVDVTVGFDRIVRKIRGLPAEHALDPPAAASPEAALSETIEITPSGLSLHVSDPQQPADAALDDAEIERWRVHDLSSRGFGLIVDRGASDTVLLNGLVGLRNNETGGWLVGSVVRKLPNRVRGEVLVGIEVLSFRPIVVDLEHARRGEATTALYLPGTDTNGKLDSIIVRATDFSSDNAYDLKVGPLRYRVNLNRIIRKGADWIKARFEIQGKS